MNSRVSWSVDGIDPSVRERAETAARRAGMSLNDWLNANIGDASPDFRNGNEPRQAAVSQQHRAVDDIHQRLDSITRQIEQISKPRTEAPRTGGQAPRGEQPAVARQLNDAISRLDARLSQITNPQAGQQAERQDQQRQSDMVERAANQVYRNSPPLSPSNFNTAIAEIAARQNALDEPPQQVPPRHAPPMAPQAPQATFQAPQATFAPQPRFVPPQQFDPQPQFAPPRAPQASFAPQSPAPAPQVAPPAPPPGPDFSSLERHLFKITSQIEALQRPDNVEQSIAAFRGELAEIRHAITEAMPRRAIESIENEIRSLSRRIDDTRSSGIDDQALAGIERALADIREVLLSLKPAEQLAGYDEAIRNLHAKLDLILRANDDPSTVHQLEGAIAALRSIVSNVASNDALARLSDDVQTLSARVDQLAHSAGHGDALAMIEQRIAALTSTIESREQQRPVESNNNEYIESAIRSLSERIDRMPVGNDNASAFAHLEQRVSYLLERVEAADQRDSSNNNLDRVEDALQDILRHLETQHANLAAIADNSSRQVAAPPPQMDPDLIDAVKRELSDIRFSQSETDRRTQDALETVHSTLGHVVDRLAMIEGDLRNVRAAPPPASEPSPAPLAPAAVFAAPEPEAPRMAMPPMPKPELPNPAAAQAPFPAPAAQEPFAAPAPQEHFVAAPREFHAAGAAVSDPPPLPAAMPSTPRAISEILVPHTTRTAIEPDLPPDHPLEPGTRPTMRSSSPSPSERIAASEEALSEIPAAASGPKEAVSTSSFIAAARRAAQAAAANAQNDKRSTKAAAKATSAAKPKEKAKDKPKDAEKPAAGTEGSSITSKIRSLLVGASVVVIVLGTFKMAMNLLDTGTAPSVPAMEEPTNSLSPADRTAAPPAPAAPSMTSPTPLGRQSNNSSAPNMLDSSQITITQGASGPVAAPIGTGDITGAIPPTPAPAPMPRGRLGQVQVPPTEQLPDGIGGPVLRSAALKGDASAAYEVGVRFAEGKGVAANLDEAAKWYDRAANAGVVPAIFRLGTFYEKGLAVKRDVDIARRYYLQAAERGNAKAMHNLAVLDADGGGKGANYQGASQWFRKAADRGVADSQYNLGILYARGIGVDQNLAESFKWFSLAAAQGDADAGRKRDDIAKRLDPQSLAAAKLAIQTFTAEPQPDDAVNVTAPAGGWDVATTQASAAKPAAKPAKRAAPVTAAH